MDGHELGGSVAKHPFMQKFLNIQSSIEKYSII